MAVSGAVLQFDGAITNTTGSIVYLNADNFSLNGFTFGAFFVSASPQLQARTSTYGEVPDDWPRWTEGAEMPGYANVVLRGERGEMLAIW